MTKNKDDLVSIIMPAYNASRYLPDAIESVLAQTHENWELLIVDDCSKDSSVEVIRRYRERDSRVKLLLNKQNLGPALSRNYAIKNANGRYIAFLDSDDIWSSDKLNIQLKVMNNYRHSFTYTSYHRISEDGKAAGKKIDVPNKLNYRQLLKNTAIVTSSVVLDISRIGTIQMKRTYYDDFACWLEVLKKGVTAYGIDKDLVCYRVTSASVSRNKLRSAMHVWNTYRTVEELNILTSISCFLGYAYNATKKYLKD